MLSTKKRFESWLDKYYPIKASQCEIEEALDLSILKWEGLQEEVLKEYGLKLTNGRIQDECTKEILFSLSSSNCHLCTFYSEPSFNTTRENRCKTCPLYKVKQRRCDHSDMFFDKVLDPSPWALAVQTIPNTKPMLELLKEAKKLEEEPRCKDN